MTIIVAHNRYRIRGGEDSVYETECRMLEEAGHRVVRYEKRNDDIPDGGVFARIGVALRTVWNPRTVREIRALVRETRPDVIHCHNTFPLISPSIYWAAAREGVPVVQTLHNYRLACLNGYLFREGRPCEDCLGRVPWRGVCRRCYRGSAAQSAVVAAMLLFHRAAGTWLRKVSRFVALTDFAKEKFVAAGIPADKIDVKPNVFVGSAPGRRKDRDSAAPPKVVFVGRLSPEKGVDVLVRAWAALKRRGGLAASRDGAPRFPGAADSGTGLVPACVIVGDGPERAALESLASSLGVSEHVEFLGSLPRGDALGVLSSASLLVFPSLWYEQFAITPLEAMALGVPVLVSDAASSATIVENGVTGRFFKSGDPESLASVLKELLADPAGLRRMGEAAEQAFRESDCVPERNLARLTEIYAAAARP